MIDQMVAMAVAGKARKGSPDDEQERSIIIILLAGEKDVCTDI